MRKFLVLIVDDDKENLQLLGKMLKLLDVSVSYATSGQAALRVLQEIIPDLIILDIMMPGMDGFELCKKLSESKRTSEIAIIFLSAKNNIDDIVKGFKLGAKDYIGKPFIREELIARVQTQLSAKKNNDQLEQLSHNLKKIVDEKTEKLNQSNIALQVLLDKRERDKDILRNQITRNFKEYVLPLLERLRTSSLDTNQLELLKACENNLKEIFSPILKTMTLSLYGLTHRELKIANLIIQGKSSMEISDMLNTSESTIAYHRKNIRKKLGIINKKVNLHIYLRVLDQSAKRNKMNDVDMNLRTNNTDKLTSTNNAFNKEIVNQV